MQAKKIKAVIFGFGNTLVRQNDKERAKLEMAGHINLIDFFYKKNIRHIKIDNWRADFERVVLFHKNGTMRNLIETDIHRVFRYLSEIYHLPSDIRPELMAQIFYLPLSQSRILFEDAIPVLKSLQTRGITIGMISNTMIPGPIMNQTLERLQIKDYFSFMLYSSDLGFRKPHPAVFDLAITLSGCKAPQILMVGDKVETDINGSSESGMRAVLIKREEKKGGVRKSYSVVRSLYDIIPIIEK